MSFYTRVKDRWPEMTRYRLTGSAPSRQVVNETINRANKGEWLPQCLLVLLALDAARSRGQGLQVDLEDLVA